jgi:hypothetical protein
LPSSRGTIGITTCRSGLFGTTPPMMTMVGYVELLSLAGQWPEKLMTDLPVK